MINYFGKTYKIVHDTYKPSGRPALILVAQDGEKIVLSVNMPNEKIDEGEYFIKTWSEHKELAAAAMASGHFEDTGRRVASGFVKVEVWKLIKDVSVVASSSP